MKTCKRCEVRVKDWEGSDPKCAFINTHFTYDNWNCATMNALRDLIPDVNYEYSEDQYAGLIAIPEEGSFIVMGWYKHRGQTEFAEVIQGIKRAPLTEEIANKALGEQTKCGEAQESEK